jgi:hypothetical protein
MMTETRPTYEQLEAAARILLAAMDRQYGNSPFSRRVNDARGSLRQLLPVSRDDADKAVAA